MAWALCLLVCWVPGPMACCADQYSCQSVSLLVWSRLRWSAMPRAFEASSLTPRWRPTTWAATTDGGSCPTTSPPGSLIHCSRSQVGNLVVECCWKGCELMVGPSNRVCGPLAYESSVVEDLTSGLHGSAVCGSHLARIASAAQLTATLS